ncbi:MAG: hypothetical protein UV59_C0024G0006 [Candidatus Gottesmanbacteria bacterium GW2011_GWA1_43_11]|uniref:Uncharacterized protein n=1 Tax=Candidatus Gottesmanbacteria bacterium GW2011_GWA1_43_11 TaxID=1618436 RepID=A0A0G1CEQ7_9BACT|nr:MAG: hypothetical protein UV59_C0024G0006 [Candidatus Gottesmanbacteria bacterium GW2011_GWA1_43_11]
MPSLDDCRRVLEEHKKKLDRIEDKKDMTIRYQFAIALQETDLLVPNAKVFVSHRFEHAELHFKRCEEVFGAEFKEVGGVEMVRQKVDAGDPLFPVIIGSIRSCHFFLGILMPGDNQPLGSWFMLEYGMALASGYEAANIAFVRDSDVKLELLPQGMSTWATPEFRDIDQFVELIKPVAHRFANEWRKRRLAVSVSV